MNLKNFPKKLDSKTSCLRITVPENLDLALEGLIRKVLREQPKVDDIYAFAADYFDTLLKIRDKAGAKFTADQFCPFHNDEDAHEMIKLASTFAKPGNIKTKTPEIERTTNVAHKTIRKEPCKSTGKSDKKKQIAKQLTAIEKKTGKKIEPERPKTLKLEPKTEDLGEDEEFLKSDPIKVLVEKELMDEAKSQPKDKEKEGEVETHDKQNGKLEEIASEELRAVDSTEKDNTRTEVGKTDEIISNGKNEKTHLKDAAKSKEGISGEVQEEIKTMNKTEIEIQNESKDKALTEGVTEALNSEKDLTAEEIRKELQDNIEDNQEAPKIQAKNVEIKPEKDHIQAMESPAAEKKTEKSFEKEIKTDANKEEIADPETNQKASEETTKGQLKPTGKSLEDRIELESDRKDEQAEQDASKEKLTEKPSTEEEADLNPDELCTVVDVLSIKRFEQEEIKPDQVKEVEAKEPECLKVESADKIEIKKEETPPEEQKEIVGTQKSVEITEKVMESAIADKAEEIALSPNDKEVQQKFENVSEKVTDESQNMAKSGEKVKIQTESDVKITDKEAKIDSFEDQKLIEANAKATPDDESTQTTKVTTDDGEDQIVPEAKAEEEKEKSEATVANGAEVVITAEEQVTPEEKPMEESKNKEHRDTPKKAEASVGSGIKIEEETQKGIDNETKVEESVQNLGKREDNEDSLKLEQTDSIKIDRKPSEEPSNIGEEEIKVEVEVTEQLEVEKEVKNVELKLVGETESVKEIKDKTEILEAEKPSEEEGEKDGVKEIVEGANQTTETLLKGSEIENSQDSTKAMEKIKEPATAETNTVERNEDSPLGTPTGKGESNQKISGDELCTVVDTQHVIKVEEVHRDPEGIQIKTIQTHYYDTLPVPETVAKEYRVHTVENDNVIDNSLNFTNVVPPPDQLTAATEKLPEPPNQEPDKKDLEDSLMTPLSENLLNLSKLSVQAISEMFLDNEKQYSSVDREERRCVTKPGEKCGDENRVKKQEVEEIIQKTIVPSTIGATPVAPRDDTEIKEEANIEGELKSEKKEDLSLDSNEPADSSNGGRSIDSDTPIISVEVRTMIETEIVENEQRERDEGERTGGDDSDVQIRIEATIEVPEEIIADLTQKKNKDEVRQHASDDVSVPETISKDSQTSSAESESTISSTATEIKRSDSAKRLLGSTRTLISTQSLDLDKRNHLLRTRSLSSFRQGVTDFEVWNAIEKELEEAATKIQSNFRGYKTRKKLQRENAVQITTEESSYSASPVEPESERWESRQQSTGEFHDSIVLSEHPR